MNNFIFKNRIVIILSLISLVMISCKENSDRISKRNAILNSIKAPVYPSNSISILDLGAVPDSVTDCKPAFDKGMRECTKLKGSKIVIPPGIYYIEGPIHLVNNVCLEIQKGARLKFSSNPQSYLPVVKTSWEGTFLYNYSPFIYGYQLENVIITGEGTIDGNASESFSKWKSNQNSDLQLSREMNHNNVPVEKRIFGENHFLRPQLIQLNECKNILIEGVHITNSPFWCIHLLKSENATLRNLSYDAKNANNDGIDPEYSTNILIENIDFDNGDDNIAIKAGRDDEGRETNIPSENIIIRNCRFKGLHGVVIGSEMSAGVRNVFIENSTYRGYCKRGIYVKSNPDRGGFIRDIYINNVRFDQVEDCFYITSYYHNEGEGHNTEIYNIYVDSLFCNRATNTGLVIQGFPALKVKDIYFSNVQIDSAATGLSFTETENIVMSNVVIGKKAEAPTYVK